MNYALLALFLATAVFAAFFIRFERTAGAAESASIAVMVALSAVGRLIFAPLQFFKPVSALTIICGEYWGARAGFTVGALCAVVSNIYYGQGPWTPFQMLAWGIIGLLSGLLGGIIKKSRVLLCIVGILSGAIFSLVTDVFTTLFADGYFNLSRYGALLLTALPVTIEYAVSNVIFLLLLEKPIGAKMERMQIKYNVFERKASK